MLPNGVIKKINNVGKLHSVLHKVSSVNFSLEYEGQYRTQKMTLYGDPVVRPMQLEVFLFLKPKNLI